MPVSNEREAIRVRSERAVLAAVRLPDSVYDARDPFGELRALAEQAGAIVVGTLEQRLERPNAGTYIGTGKLAELKALCAQLEAGTVIFDHDLSPRQIANIEEAVERKVIDRSELILDIFASRATTTEAKLQVELAQLEYTYPRLRAMWSHLERIVGSGGIAGIGTRGPGEQQLEIDRRLAQSRRLALKKRIDQIQDRKRRMVALRNVDHFTVGLVGYTNAGKSTLFNTLTEGGAYADDRLFATLVTRTREWDLGGGVNAMLSDTVGFVRDLPHHLIASFRATLEEATHAHALIVVLDVSDPACELHASTVNQTLAELFGEIRRAEEKRGGSAGAAEGGAGGDGDGGGGGGGGVWREPARLIVLNKVDKLKDNASLLVWQQREPGAMAVQANRPDDPGIDRLRQTIRAMAVGEEREREITVDLRDSRTVDTLEKRGRVVGRAYRNGSVTLRVVIGQRPIDQLRSLGAQMRIAGEEPPARGWKPAPESQ
ncbi:MAG: GTPase HflX [Isosphaera sp.]|nr:GTPase HflX [Isosphaera sp.]